MRKWFGTARKAYNQTIEYLKTPGSIASPKVKSEILNQLPEWSKETPYAVRGDACLEAVRTVQRAKQDCRKDGVFRDCKFRSRKDPTQGIRIQGGNVRNGIIYPTSLGALKASETIEGTSDGRLILENGRWFYIESKEVTKGAPDNQRLSSVAIDPGVRTFATLYSPEMVGKFGSKDINKLLKLLLCLDRLMSKMASVTAKSRYRMKKAANRIRWRVKDLVREFHTKLGVWLCKTFKTIYLPTFETSQMVSSVDRILSKKSVRQMLTWSHFKFKERLKQLAFKYGSTVVDVNEAYTSKTCTSCGTLNPIGSKSILRCKCGTTIDRDINGARGIFLRALRDTSCTLAQA